MGSNLPASHLLTYSIVVYSIHQDANGAAQTAQCCAACPPSATLPGAPARTRYPRTGRWVQPASPLAGWKPAAMHRGGKSSRVQRASPKATGNSGPLCEPRIQPCTMFTAANASSISPTAGNIPWQRTISTGSSLPTWRPASLAPAPVSSLTMASETRQRDDDDTWFCYNSIPASASSENVPLHELSTLNGKKESFRCRPPGVTAPRDDVRKC